MIKVKSYEYIDRYTRIDGIPIQGFVHKNLGGKDVIEHQDEHYPVDYDQENGSFIVKEGIFAFAWLAAIEAMGHNVIVRMQQKRVEIIGVAIRDR